MTGRGRRTALAAVIIGVVLCAGAGIWFREDLRDWLAFRHISKICVENENVDLDRYAVVTIFERGTFPGIKSLRKRFLASLTGADPSFYEETMTRSAIALAGAVSFHVTRDPEKRDWNRFTLSYYLIDSAARMGVVFSEEGNRYLCEEQTWSRFIGSVLQLAVPELKATLEDQSAPPEDRVNIGHTLSWVIPADPAVLRFHQDLLRNSSYEMHAIYALASMGRWAKPAVPKLLELAMNKDLLARIDAVRALGKIGDERAVPVLERLADEDGLEESAGEALKKIRAR